MLRGGTVKYVILIYGNPASRAVWEGLSKEQRQTGLAAYEALNHDLTESGELIASEALGDPGTGRRLPPDPDVDFATDGPFAEAKEFVAGFILIDTVSLERALEVAARVPEAGLGLVEVRPTMDLSAFDL
jgi:hypothetical protein